MYTTHPFLFSTLLTLIVCYLVRFIFIQPILPLASVLFPHSTSLFPILPLVSIILPVVFLILPLDSLTIAYIFSSLYQGVASALWCLLPRPDPIPKLPLPANKSKGDRTHIEQFRFSPISPIPLRERKKFLAKTRGNSFHTPMIFFSHIFTHVTLHYQLKLLHSFIRVAWLAASVALAVSHRPVVLVVASLCFIPISIAFQYLQTSK
jgi:hypothetical protein